MDDDEKLDGGADSSSPACLPTAIVFHVASFLTPNDVCSMGATCRKWREVCCSDLQPLWREFVSKKFGRKYENYVTFTGDSDWRCLYLKISAFISNLRRGNAKVKYYPALLEPPLSDSYEGCLAMTTDCSRLLWENGRVLQCVDVEQGKELWRVSVSNRKSGASRPSVVVGKSKVFLHLEQQVHVYELSSGAFVSLLSIPPDTDASLAPLGCTETTGNNMPLDVSLRNMHFTFLTKRTLFVFHSESLQLLYKVQHRELTPLIDTVEGIDFCWAGNQCCAGPDGTECHECSANGLMLRPQCQQICRHIVTWLVKRSRSIKIWDIRDGSNVYCLRGHDAPVQKVRHVMNWRDLADYFLASLDTEGSVRIWGSHDKHFFCLHELKPDVSRGTVFRMSFSTTHLMTMSKEAAGGDVLITVWKFNQAPANALLRIAHRSLAKKAHAMASGENGTDKTNWNAPIMPRTRRWSKQTVDNTTDREHVGAATQHALPSSFSHFSQAHRDSRIEENGTSRSTRDSHIRCGLGPSLPAEADTDEAGRTENTEREGCRERVPRSGEGKTEEHLREKQCNFYRKRISSSCRDGGRHQTETQPSGGSAGRDTHNWLFECGTSANMPAHGERPARDSIAGTANKTFSSPGQI
ncbi:F-box domain-containing protein [Toxoplasma gondii TgCatPRC2]|uniref:F-box domain-containing protein n=5 Tax=Toxoplasma gondii TaxID=5811 RepID=B6KVB8_TOXGV|nr:F-box domain-containing protein [Toxoplasma gondii ME49]ESS30411.1 F-box domain-containing protein [Toxoplasma gondii VEG]KFG35368.1 F-box domain-containing protein [Toxoplasma gondii GAB2-2007-GAL-DOM2]KYF42057.1 F-box domain-containing protein [Toxoplasma gondii ARI]KYK67279.1 F-box domain-containing protein [Toxoplasma gondii TgCatPRC2]EPT31653.1 F-box domain-containing protein [Toxoplasma gondii ME49]|eukprot:XP_002371791.1 F-box domain-containing protein [Toxoplasma gondii ME49]